MGRPRSRHVEEVKEALRARLRGGFARPGDRFLSARAVAQRFEVSYQTAHRLLAELEAEGLLERRPASGTYLPGERAALRGVQLVFHSRAQRQGSFGWHLRELLETALRKEGIEVVQEWSRPGAPPGLVTGYYPVFWECEEGVAEAAERQVFALRLNDRPPYGSARAVIDALTVDDYSGGVCAAEILLARLPRNGRVAVLAGPEPDVRNRQRVAGFLSAAPRADVSYSKSWYKSGGRACAAAILRGNPDGVFCCNDRLAEAMIEHCSREGRPRPLLVGFDNAPVAERLRLTTIGLPWQAMVAEATRLAVARLQGNTAPARTVTLSHDPVIRLTT